MEMLFVLDLSPSLVPARTRVLPIRTHFVVNVNVVVMASKFTFSTASKLSEHLSEHFQA